MAHRCKNKEYKYYQSIENPQYIYRHKVESDGTTIKWGIWHQFRGRWVRWIINEPNSCTMRQITKEMVHAQYPKIRLL